MGVNSRLHSNHVANLCHLALVAFVAIAQTSAGGVLKDCMTCGKDIEGDIKDCADNSTTDAVVKCVLEAMKTSADCLHCVCDISVQQSQCAQASCKPTEK